jgi:preprotein translocase subunit SecA
VEIPTNKPMIREDFQDRIYKDEDAKYNAVVREIEEVNKNGQPILVGTVSIEKSERLGEMLKRKGISARILNASPARLLEEAAIVSDAGKPKAVTIATNMAGRGVDIVLGGKEPGRKDTIKYWNPEACTLSAQNGTRPAVLITSYAVVPDVRVTLAAPVFPWPWMMTS